MAIATEEIKLSYDEWKIKGELLFFEEANQLSSENGDEIRRGIFMSTNRGLFFFDMDAGPLQQSKKSRLLSLSFSIAKSFVPIEGAEKIIKAGEILTELTEYGLSRLENGYLNFEPSLDKKKAVLLCQ
jgi:hypothetical protein